MKKKIISTALSLAMLIPSFNTVMAQDVTDIINGAYTTEQMRAAVTENAEILGVDASALANMTVVYRDLAQRVTDGEHFDTDTFKTAFSDTVMNYMTKQEITPDQFANYRRLAYGLTGNAKNVVINQTVGFSAYSCIFICGYELPDLTDIKKMEFETDVTSFRNTRTVGWVYYDLLDAYPTEMTEGTYDESSNEYAAFKAYIDGRPVSKRLFEFSGKVLDLDYIDVPGQTWKEYTGTLKIDISTALTDAKENGGIFVLSGGAGENVSIEYSKIKVNLYSDNTVKYLDDAKAAVENLKQYDFADGVTKENKEEAQVGVYNAQDSLAIVDDCDEKCELEAVVERVQNYIYIVDIDESLIKMEELPNGEKLNSVTAEDSQKTGFSDGWYKDSDFIEKADDSVVYTDGNFVSLDNTSVFRGILKPYSKTGNTELLFGYRAKVNDGKLSFSVSDKNGICIMVFVDNGKLKLSVPNMPMCEEELEDNFNGLITLRISNNSVTAAAVSDNVRKSVSVECDYTYETSIVSFQSDGANMFGGLVLQKYPNGYGSAAQTALDEVQALIDNADKENAIAKYETAEKSVDVLAEGVIKDDLSAYLKKLSSKIDEFREDIKVSAAEDALKKAEETKAYADFVTAKEVVEKVSDTDRKKALDERLSSLETAMKGMTPYVKSAEIKGSWSVGAVLTVEYTIQDDYGTKGDNLVEWLVGGNVVKSGSDTITVIGSYAGKTVTARITPSNIFGVKGTAYTTLGVTIPSSGGSGGGGGGGNTGGSTTIKIYSTPEPSAAPEPTETGFKDISGHWAEKIIKKLTEKKIINGISEDEFAPNEYITRAQFASLVSRILEIEKTDYIGEFTDVSKDDWFATDVEALCGKCIINGSNGEFMPNSNITREAMAKILVAAYEYKTAQTVQQAQLTFSDSENISDWAAEFVGKAVNAGLLKGSDDNKFMPRKNATRAEAAAAINNLINGLEGR